MSLGNLLGACVGLLPLLAAGCGWPAGEASLAIPNGSPAAEVAVEQSSTLPTEDDAWRGLERHEIQLDQKLLIVKGSKGVIGCPYLNVGSFEKFGEACAIIPAVDTAGMLDSKVTAVTAKAKELGIEVGMPGREALDRIR
jgi:uncharacterized protein YunC (DUF1805 family)